MPKAPPVRPRSKLSVRDEHLHHHHHKDTHRRGGKRVHNALLTLAGFCIFLFVLCAFLLGALVYVGRNIASDTTNTYRTSLNLTDANGRFAYAIPFDQEQRLEQERLVKEQERLAASTPILRFRTTSPNPQQQQKLLISRATLLPKVMSASKVLQQLSFRLPKELRPRHYRLRLQPDLQNKSFSGNVTIRLQVLQPISFIPVHSKLLNVTTQKVARLNDEGTQLEQLEPSLTFLHPELEYWVTEFAQPLVVGNYSLQLAFNGSLTDRIVGFYQSSYLDKQTNTQRLIATSKFEPTFARQAFPCFDEPALKAQFEVTIVRPTGNNYHALSNMNIESEVAYGDVTEVTFQESVPMSTYLVCFIVSDFTSLNQTVRGVLPGASDFEMRVFSTVAQVDKVKYALETGVGITEFYIEYFNISYPLPKLDMAGIPDFVSGAMEHWGLVTFRETALLYDTAISSSVNKQHVATVVAHELAHMWFGNLVTMKWWNDLWLNEGFASYVEYKGVNHVHPEWEMLDQFITDEVHGIMGLDATLASHPIVQTVESPSQITELFDGITYSKGASVIRMLEDLVGADKFRNATINYLWKYYYSNAETDDFLTEVDALEPDVDVKSIMQTWTEQMGFPVVQVTQESSNVYKLTQKRFFSNPEDYNGVYDDSQFNYHWSIPITFITSASNTPQRTIFNYNDNEVRVTVQNAVDWIKFNSKQVGYYRVNYPESMWQTLISALKTNRGVLSGADRAQLLNDVFALANAAQLEYRIALDLSTYLLEELDYLPWKVGFSELNSLHDVLYYTNIYRELVLYARNLMTNVYTSVTWTVGSDHLQNILRLDALSAACKFGIPEALQEAATRFNNWLANTAARPEPDVRPTVYYYGMEVAGNEKVWDQVWQVFLSEQDATEKSNLMRALAAIKVPWILQRYINLAWDESNVRRQDYLSCLQYIAQNRIGQSLVWDHVRENWPQLVARFGINERNLGRLIPAITKRFSTQTKLDEMEQFFAKYPEAGAGTAARKQALEAVKYNIKWLQENKEQVGQWLAAAGDTKRDKLEKKQ